MVRRASQFSQQRLSISGCPTSLVLVNSYDVAIIGGGAAGLSAALVLTRARRRVVVIDAGRPRNAPAAHLQGFLTRDGMPPADLLKVGREEVTTYGANLVDDSVTAIVPHGDGTFGVQLASGESMSARRLLFATGLRDVVPEVPGVQERWGRDVLHCPYCHGYEVRDQPVAVLGGTPGSVEHALLLRQWSHDVVYFTHGSDPTEAEREQLTARAVGIVEGEVAELVVEDDRLTHVRMEDGREIPRRAVFVRPAFVPNDTLLPGLGAEVDAHGWPSIDPTGRTTVPGVWAAGNAVNPRAQVVTAAGEGSAAAIAINNDLVVEDTHRDVESYRAGRPAGPPTPPTKHQLALMIWLCVFPTLTVINLALADWLSPMPVMLRTFVLATIAVPIVIYGLMPHLHRARVRILTTRRA